MIGAVTSAGSPRVVVAGEALVDLAPRDDGLVPLPGGSPVNVAVGLGRLGVPTGYLGHLSHDGFGRLLAGHLADAGVDLRLTARVAAPTTLAVVHLDADGGATYGFYLDGTSAAALTVGDLPPLPEGACLHVSFGAVGVTTAPAGEALVHLVRREAGRRVVSLDPNVRPSALDDPARCRDRLEDAVAASDVVKASEEDLRALHPDLDPEVVAARWATTGPALVVVTRGRDGAVAFGAPGRLEVPSHDVRVVDTVGAGDAFTAGLLAALAAGGLLTPEALRRADAPALAAALDHAALVAARTCERPGADPPTADELAAAGRPTVTGGG